MIRLRGQLALLFLLILPAVGAAQRAGGRLLLILDDLGHPLGSARTEACFALPREVAFSIIPGTPQAARLGARCLRQGRDYLAHLPWEPLRHELPGERLLLPLRARPERLAQLLALVERELPALAAANNHQGSQASLDVDFLKSFAQAWQPLELPFVDSRTVAGSRVPEVLGAGGVRVFENQLFLDHVDSDKAIAAELERLAEIARGRELTIAIFHPRPRSLRLLAAWLATTPAGVVLVGAREALASPPQDWLAQVLPPAPAREAPLPDPAAANSPKEN